MSRYSIQQIGVDNDYIEYISPTQILGMLSKGDALIQWACNICVEKNDRFAWKQKRDSTADIGSELHHLVESFININLNYTDEVQRENRIDKYLFYVQTLDYKLRQMFYQFYNWQKKYVMKWLESEKPVLHRDLCYAGTCDFIFQGYNEKIYLCDLKTSNAIYDTHETQSVAYKYAREKMNDKYKVQFNQDGQTWIKTFEYPVLQIDECAVLRISRDFFDLEFKPVEDVEYKMQSFVALLKYYYVSAKRRIKNKRAKERR